MQSIRALALACSVMALVSRAHAEAPSPDCLVGAYRLTDGRVLDLGATDGPALRYRMLDGTTGALRLASDGAWATTFGWTERRSDLQIAPTSCDELKVVERGAALTGARIAFVARDTRFRRGAIELAGRLVLPAGNARVPIVVLVHGAERTSARAMYALQRILPAEGIGAFVYDKRGTGASGGQYTQDFGVLADDAVAALREAKRLAGPRAGRIGYQGGSQGGWVAPLAAQRAQVDFVVVSFGLAVSPVEEDDQEVELEMRLAGHGPEETAKALEVARAAQAIMISGFSDGFRRFDELRAKYRKEPWYKDLRGNMTRYLLPYTEEELREKGQAFKFGTPWHYDSLPVLRSLTVPQLWALGEDDLDAPSAETARRLAALIAQGKPITLAVFAGAEHGMTEYELAPSGERVSTRFAPGYFAMLRDFVRDGRIGGTYGRAVITQPKRKRVQ